MRRRRRKRVVAGQRVPLVAARQANDRWSMDFTRDTLADGRAFRTLNTVDDHSRESPVIEVDQSLPARRVVRILERLAETRGLREGSSSTTDQTSPERPSTAERTTAACTCTNGDRPGRERSRGRQR